LPAPLTTGEQKDCGRGWTSAVLPRPAPSGQASAPASATSAIHPTRTPPTLTMRRRRDNEAPSVDGDPDCPGADCDTVGRPTDLDRRDDSIRAGIDPGDGTV